MGQARRKEKHPEANEPKSSSSEEATSKDTGAGPHVAWKKPEGLSGRGWAVLCGVLVALQFPLIHYALLRGEAPTTAQVPYAQDFSDPGVVKRDFFSTGGLWRVVNGQLLSPGVKNNPLWLQAALPQNVAVEFDVRSESPEGDIKVELFGDGTDHASGYIFIHGGWNNTLSIIARLDEHGAPLTSLQAQARQVAEQRGASSQAGLVDTGVFKKKTHMRVEARPYPVKRGQTYHWRIERRGSLLRWSIDGKPFMEFDDPIPLVGKGHDRFGFSSWEAQLYFDNLKIEPL
ncbi:hypothetical protein [Melittangium boletus]|uniref:Farnesoic acid O-methyl transferase domain-containing protein n=1 Tax=Melittangium boletus DSM 14713 TaxID=1294270 RepID=A0A250I880_9BACT|nr:hypothetical protein [Melittangium boletus]ATB28079.1 hypothetical protein MEBOL_001524 [Melittangium boletus DSM 14713]